MFCCWPPFTKGIDTFGVKQVFLAFVIQKASSLTIRRGRFCAHSRDDKEK